MRYEGVEMSYRRWALAALLAVLGLVLAGCAQPAAETTGENPPAVVEPIEGSELATITLTAKAAERIGLVTAKVAAAPAGNATGATAIPYSAVLYDIDGATWTFTSPKPLVFVRQAIDVDAIRGDMAVLSEGPPAGTDVVTVGAAELLGAELGVEGE
jgi:hypothetical protein